MLHQQYTKQAYREQEVIGASPVRLVVMAYDLAIGACQQGDFVRAIKAISVLRDALNFDYPEASVGLFRLYQWCMDCIRSGDYENAIVTLSELRDAWAIAEKKLEVTTSQTKSPSVLPIRQTSKPIASA